MTEVNFCVKCDATRFGECVALVGNIMELGEWNTEKALILDTKPDTYPTWHIKLTLPKNAIIEYKYLIITYRTVKGQSGQPESIPFSLTWENLGSSYSNRRLNTFDKKLIHLNDEMNSKVVVEEYVEDKSGVAAAAPSYQNGGVSVAAPTYPPVGSSVQ